MNLMIDFIEWLFDDYPYARCYKCGSKHLKQEFGQALVTSNYLRPLSSECGSYVFRTGYECRNCGFKVKLNELVPKEWLKKPGFEEHIRNRTRSAWMTENPGKDPDRDI